MGEETETLYVRITVEQSQLLDTWINEQNRVMGPFLPKLSKQAAVRMLLDEGIASIRAKAAAATKDAKATTKARRK